jgi:hypothetical protein
MLKTRKFGKLNSVGRINVKKIGGYEELQNLFNNHGINYEKDTISANYGKFGGGQIYENEDSIIISSYSQLVRPRRKAVGELYVYELYIINKEDFQKIKNKLPIQQDAFNNKGA